MLLILLHFLYQEIAEEDERALEHFMAKDAPARRTLGDIIMEKLTEKQTEVASQMTGTLCSRAKTMDCVIKAYLTNSQGGLCKVF